MWRQVSFFLYIWMAFQGSLAGQTSPGRLDSFRVHGDIKVTVDHPAELKKHKETIIVFYALPNGNTTLQTIGKRMKPGDDWHFDIQHIGAQTVFIRRQLRRKNLILVCLENDLKSWPDWKQRHPDFTRIIPGLIDSLAGLFTGIKKNIYLNGHSGGGSFIFGYLAGVGRIPGSIKRISFLDSDYGYDSSYYPLLKHWLNEVPGSALNVFAYNDSVALYNGKPVVSATGGTWYRSHLMLRHLQNDFPFFQTTTDSLLIYTSNDRRVQFFFKPNRNRGIYHTEQVERNGFIHSVLCGTRYDSKKYRYYGKRAYDRFIK